MLMIHDHESNKDDHDGGTLVLSKANFINALQKLNGNCAHSCCLREFIIYNNKNNDIHNTNNNFALGISICLCIYCSWAPQHTWVFKCQRNIRCCHDYFILVFKEPYKPLQIQKRVWSDNQNGKYTQGDIICLIKKKGAQSKTGTMSVKSCFGGLAAYRAYVYFADECQYQLASSMATKQDDNTSIMRYASAKEKRPCEHVVFHDCLKNSSKVEIAIDPNLITFWSRNM